MKRFFKIFKLVLAGLFSAYSLLIIYLLGFSPQEKRYDFAAHMQGGYLSQTIFEILKFQDPSNHRIYFEQSVPYNKRGEYKKGFAILNKAVELQPKMYLGYRGYMKLRFLRDYEGALEDFNRLDSLTPNFIDAPWGEDIDFVRGESYFGLENFGEAKTHFKKSIQNQGKDWADVQSFVYVGLCEYKMGNQEEAIKYYNEALDKSQYVVEAHIELARIYLEKEEEEIAQSHLDKAKKYFTYKRSDSYNEYLNEVYLSDIASLEDPDA